MLRVAEEIDCPLFRVGDQMVLDLPGVDKGSSTNICTLAVAKFLADSDHARCETLASPIERGQFTCPRAEHPVAFQVEELPERFEPKPVTGDLIKDIPAAVAHLRSIPIFRALPATFLAQLAQRMRTEQHADQEIILQKGHPGRAFFVVAEGTVEVMDFADHEVASVVTRLREKDCFGEMSILTGTPVAATVRARGNVSLYVVDESDFDLLLRENPFMAARFTRLMASRLVASNFRFVREGAKPFSGKLDVMNIVTVVQVLADSGRSGTLYVDDYSRTRAALGYSDGRLFDAKVQDLAGEEALFEVLTWKRGDFWFDPKEVPNEDRIQQGVMNLLLEGMRRIDEADRDGG